MLKWESIMVFIVIDAVNSPTKGVIHVVTWNVYVYPFVEDFEENVWRLPSDISVFVVQFYFSS